MSNGYALCSHSLCAIVLRRFFKSDRSTRSGAVQAAQACNTPFLFLPSFFLCGYTAKEKSVTKANYLLIPRLLSRFSLVKKAQRKANKRNAESPTRRALLRAERHLLKKVDENNHLVLCEHTAKSQFIYLYTTIKNENSTHFIGCCNFISTSYFD